VGINTRLYISIGIDVKISLPSGNASPDMRTIIPEIEDEHGFGSPEIHDLFSEMVSLLWSNYEIDIALAIDRDIKKIHLSDNPFFKR
jgi:hypothetical protein